MSSCPSGCCSSQSRMAAIVQCLLRNCFEYGDDDGEHGGGNGARTPSLPPRLRSMVRAASGGGGGGGAEEHPQRGGYFAPTAGLTDPHEEEEEDAEAGESSATASECEARATASSSSAGAGSRRASFGDDGEAAESPPQHPSAAEQHCGGVRGLFRRLGFAPPAGQYGRLGGVSPAPSREDTEETELSQHLGGATAAAAAAAMGLPGSPVHHRRSLSNPQHRSPRMRADGSRSPLRTASSFGTGASNHDIIPAISLEEVVLPGSDLQKQMSAAMAATLDEQGDECVICLEGFDPTNPRMPTLCGCGENRTYFHLPCLYQWIEQDRNCPSCRKRLRWEEF